MPSIDRIHRLPAGTHELTARLARRQAACSVQLAAADIAEVTTEDNGHGNIPAEIFECIEQRLPEGWRFSSETALLEDGLSAFRKVREELRESLSAEVLPTPVP